MQNHQKISLRWRRTKVIATIGPATEHARNIADLIKAGVNVFRLNMSHGEHAQHEKVFERIRRCAKKRMHTSLF